LRNRSISIIASAARAIAYTGLHAILAVAKALLVVQRAVIIALVALLIIILGRAAVLALRPPPAPPEVAAVLTALRHAPMGTLQHEQVTANDRETRTYKLDYKTEQVSVDPDGLNINNILDKTMRSVGLEPLVSGPFSDFLALNDTWIFYGCPKHELSYTWQGHTLSIFYLVIECPATTQ